MQSTLPEMTRDGLTVAPAEMMDWAADSNVGHPVAVGELLMSVYYAVV